MPVELLIASPASGKTQACIQRERAQPPLTETWVLLPDRLQAAAFRRRLAQAGGELGAHVGTFGDLYRAILERAGLDVPVASAPLQHYLLQEVVDELIGESSLPHYASLRGMPGFYLALRDSFAEMKRALVYPQQFTEFVQSGPPARQELARLYQEYQARLQDLGWADPEGLSWLAVEALQADPNLVSGLRLLVVDGFDSFTGAQLRTLELLAQPLGEILITLPGEPNSKRAAHHRFTAIAQKLIRTLSATVGSLPNSPALPPALQRLEASLFETPSGVSISPAQIFLYETSSPADEAREALRWIKKQVVRDGLSLAECAIFTPNPDSYHPFLRIIAAEFGIPVQFTQGHALLENPAIGALLSLLSLPAYNYRARALFNVLRSPYFDLHLSHEQVDGLEKICREARITEGQELWAETWAQLCQTAGQESSDLDDERSRPTLPRAEEAQALRQALDGFFALLNVPAQSQSQAAWVTWLEDLLESVGFFSRIESERDQDACEMLRETLRALVLSESILSAKPTDFPGFVNWLSNTLSGIGLPEPRLKSKASLLVGRMLEARGLRFRAVALLGLSEGGFPEVERPDPFLDEDLRQSLGLDARLNREQAGLFYQAVTRADQALLLTRPRLAEDGEEWEASPFWKEVTRHLDQSAVKIIRPEELAGLEDAASSQEVLFHLSRQSGLPEPFADLQSRWQTIQHGAAVLQARRARNPDSIYEGDSTDLAAELARHYAPEKVWSASRLESYGNCPHQFFVKTVLGLEPRPLPEVGIEASQLGGILHKILEETYKQAPNPASLDSVLETLPGVAATVFADAPREYGFSPSSAWAFEKEQLISTLHETITALEGASQDWRPFAFERKFGIDGQPVLEIQLSDEAVRLRGVIDRIDQNQQGELRVMDYKTGGSHLTPKDLQRGTRLQLPIYALAAQDALALGHVTEGLYWKIKDGEAGSLKLSKFNPGGVDGAAQILREHLGRILSGVRSGQFPPIPPKGGCPSYCPAAAWCWRYEPGFWGAK